MLSLAMLNEELAEPGRRVTLIWGEPSGGSRKPHIERHQQLQIRATVAQVPYARSVRAMKRASIEGSGRDPFIKRPHSVSSYGR